MEVARQLIASLGNPAFLKRIGLGCGRGAVVARWRFPGGGVDVDATDAVRVVMCLSGADAVRWQLEGESARRRIEAGSVSVMSPTGPPQVMVQGPVDVFQVLVEPELVADAAEQNGVQIVSRFDSPQVYLQKQLMQALVAATRDGPDDELLLGSAVYGVAEQLGNTRHASAAIARGGLAPAGRRRVEDLVRDRLDRRPEVPLSLDDLATAAGLSVHLFIEAFRHSMGCTPYAYALRCRFQRSMSLLSQPTMTVAETADRTGFGSPAHFVSSFRRHNGVTPGAFRAAILR